MIYNTCYNAHTPTTTPYTSLLTPLPLPLLPQQPIYENQTSSTLSSPQQGCVDSWIAWYLVSRELDTWTVHCPSDKSLANVSHRGKGGYHAAGSGWHTYLFASEFQTTLADCLLASRANLSQKQFFIISVDKLFCSVFAVPSSCEFCLLIPFYKAYLSAGWFSCLFLSHGVF